MLPGNGLAWWFFGRMRGLIFNGMGGLAGENIEAGLQNFNIPPELRPGLYQKLLILAAAILREKDN